MDAAAIESPRDCGRKQLAGTRAGNWNPSHHLPTTKLAAPTLDTSSGQAAARWGRETQTFLTLASPTERGHTETQTAFLHSSICNGFKFWGSAGQILKSLICSHRIVQLQLTLTVTFALNTCGTAQGNEVILESQFCPLAQQFFKTFIPNVKQWMKTYSCQLWIKSDIPFVFSGKWRS